jgi:hypothetical protein
MMRKFTRAILVLLAIIFLIEAWLWDKLEPIVARIVEIIPLKRMKIEFARWAEQLPPSATLLLFLLPQAVLIPIKVLELWFFVNGQWISGTAALILSKLVFLGTTAFVFDVTRDKLLQLDWFRGLYHYVLWLRQSAHALIDPIMRRIRRRMRILAPRRTPRAFRLLMRIRRRAHDAPPPRLHEVS